MPTFKLLAVAMASNESEVMQMVKHDKSARDMEMDHCCRSVSTIKFSPVTENWDLIKPHIKKKKETT